MQLPQLSNLVGDWRAFDGSFRDHSGHNNHATPTNVNFKKNPDKTIDFIDTTGHLVVADSAELQLTEGTLIAYGDFEGNSQGRIISKIDGGGVNYDLYYSAVNGLVLADGILTSAGAVTTDGAKSLACSFVSGSKPKFYSDGAFVTDGNAAVTITANDAPLELGSYYVNGFNIRKGGSQDFPKGFLIYNTILTDEEIAQAHLWIESTKTPSYPKKNFVYPSQIVNGKDTKYGSDLVSGMTASGWTAGSDALLSNPSANVLRIAYDGTSNPSAQKTIMTVGKKYRVTGIIRSVDGVAQPRIAMGATTIVTGTTSTSDQAVDHTFITTSTALRLYGVVTATGTASDFQDIRVTEVKETVASYDMKNVHGKIIDKTGNGNDGTIEKGITQTKGIAGTPALACSSGRIDDMDATGWNNYPDATISFWMKPNSVSAFQYVAGYGTSNDSVSFGIDSAGKATVFNDIDNSNENIPGSTTLVAGKWYHFVCSILSGGQKLAYINNKEEIDNSVVALDLTDIGTDALVFANRRDDVNYFDGEIADIRLFNYELSAAERADMYNKYAKMPYFLDSLVDANESISANGGAIGSYLENTNWKFGDTSARYKISRDSIDGLVGGDQLATDMEVATWTASGSATLTNPSSGILRVTYGGGAFPYAAQDILTVGKKYRFVGEARSDGNIQPGLRQPASGSIWSGTTSTNWQSFDIIHTATSDGFVGLMGINASAGQYVEWKNVQIHEVDDNDKVIECTVAGLLFQEMQQAYGTWEFSVKKGANANNPVIGFMMDSIEAPALTSGVGNGYSVQLNTSTFARVMATKKQAGTASNLFYTDTNYVDASGTWYHFRMTRRYDGQFTLYIKGGEYTVWTLVDVTGGLGTNPIINTVTTESKYIVFDMDALDMVSNFRFTQGIITS